MSQKQIFFSLFFIIPLIVACTTIDNRGQLVDSEQLKAIHIGKTTKEEIVEILGTPSAVSTFNNKTWFYVGQKTERVAFFSPTIMESKIVILDFNETDRVSKIDIKTEADGKAIAHAKRVTPTSGHSFSVIEQLLGNVGRFNPKSVDDKM